MSGRCPGQNIQFWGPDAIFDVFCPDCNYAVEFFKDESQRKCKKCGKNVFNPRMDFSCAKWCPSARDCLGEEKYNCFMEINQKEEKRKEEMEKLLEFVPDGDAEVKKLFQKLYLENKDGNQLFDVRNLYFLKADNPKLFEKATACFSKFTKMRESAKKSLEEPTE